jgi:hypothetical protein
MEQDASIVDAQRRCYRTAISPVQRNGAQASIEKSDDDAWAAERLHEPHRR